MMTNNSNNSNNILMKILEKNEERVANDKINNIDNKNNRNLHDKTQNNNNNNNETTKKNRCMVCNKKLGLLGIKCKCDKYFCSEHRYSDRHDCTYDYKKSTQELLIKTNPVINPSKINKL